MAPTTSRHPHQIGATINSGWLVFGEMLTESFARPKSTPSVDAVDEVREASPRGPWGAGVGRWLAGVFRYVQKVGRTAPPP